ncbi:MAG: peptidoglycan DD-metalloendopeptidase family protein [Azospirillaceae bacterium]
MPVLVLALTLLLVASGAPARAQDAGTETPVPLDRLESVESELEAGRERSAELEARAEAVAEELAVLREELVGAAERALDSQDRVAALEAEIDELAARETERAEDLAARRARLGRLVGGLQRLALVPGEALMVRAADPTEMLRGGLLLGAAVPRLESEAQALRAALTGLAETRRALTARRAALVDAVARLDARRGELDRLIARREALLEDTRARSDAMADRLGDLSREADDLRDLVARLEGDLPPRPERFGQATTRPMTEPALRDGVLMPTAGPVRQEFGSLDASGDRTTGLTLAAAAGAPVVAPLAGTVRFAGPFRGYGRVLILEHPGGYHSTLAGLGRVDVHVGDPVLAGEPVGRMPEASGAGPDTDPPADPEPGDAATKSPSLYFEFRHDGQPINPIQGLAQAQRRGRG